MAPTEIFWIVRPQKSRFPATPAPPPPGPIHGKLSGAEDPKPMFLMEHLPSKSCRKHPLCFLTIHFFIQAPEFGPLDSSKLFLLPAQGFKRLPIAP
eukprot:1156224-Pelagomonas_calceolata.AAC.5